MGNYYRITGYAPQADLGFVMDSYGMFEKLWQFSACMVQRGFKILAVGDSTKFLDGDIPKVETPDTNNMLCRAYQTGMPKETTYTLDGVTYKAYEVNGKVYVPDINQRV